MKLGQVSLRVKSLESMLAFYVEDMGLRMVQRFHNSYGDIVELGTGRQSAEPLIVLRHDPNARKSQRNAAGLYHYAVLLPNRRSLAAAYLSLGNAGVYFEGFADHLVSEALYLMDPEGNGIEIYSDRPRHQWKFDGEERLQMATLPLDIESLLLELSGESKEDLTAVFDGARIGHVHLKVTDTRRSLDFYQRILGLDLVLDWGSAVFLSVSGYHHHVGINTWESLGGPSFMNGCTGLEYFTISVPDRNFINEISSRLKEISQIHSQAPDQVLISDPDGIQLLIKAS